MNFIRRLICRFKRHKWSGYVPSEYELAAWSPDERVHLPPRLKCQRCRIIYWPLNDTGETL